MSKPKLQAPWVVGWLAIIIITPIAYRVWKAELSGFWWLLTQFGAPQFLIAVRIRQAMTQVRRAAIFQDR